MISKQITGYGVHKCQRRYKLIENGTIRKDGRRWDGSTWRKVGINHHLNEEGLVYYKRKYRTLTGYLQQGGNINRLVFNKMNPKDIGIFAKALYDNQKSGHVYLIINDAWPEWVKIGKAVDAEDRLSGYQTSSPMRDYILVHSIYIEDRHKAEKTAHKLATKIAKEVRGEWFKLNIEQAKNILDKCSVVEETKSKKEKEQAQPVIQDLFSYAETGT